MKKKHMVPKTVAVTMSAAMVLSSGTVPAMASEAKWSEETMEDGWIRITNEGGATLGYSADSGVSIIEVDGYAFKDLDKDGELDVYEDWREDDKTRAEDLASKMDVEKIQSLLFHSSVMNMDSNIDGDETFSTELKNGLRQALAMSGTSSSLDLTVEWNNALQAYVEALDYGIPFSISTNPASINDLPDNMALAATFDTELAQEVSSAMAKQYRACGVTTLLGPQIDIATDPRWGRFSSTFGEDPALSRDMAKAVTDGYQSTYDEDGTDLGWGSDSVITVAKHYPGGGTGEGGRDDHYSWGALQVYPGDDFEAHLISFFDGALSLDGATGEAASIMPSYGYSYSEDGAYGEQVGSSFSEYKISLLRNNGYDGVIVTDWGVTQDYDGSTGTPWGVENLSVAERIYKLLKNDVDQIGGAYQPEEFAEAYQMLIDDIGEEAAEAQIRKSARRVLQTFFEVDLFENPYVSYEESKAVQSDEEMIALGEEASLKAIVMLKNSDNTIQAATSEEKPSAYIPMIYSESAFGGGTVSTVVDLDEAAKYYNVVTDTLGEPTGEADSNGNATYTADDIIRATPEELAECDYALVFAEFVINPYGDGYDSESDSTVPISLQFGDYTADGDSVRQESIGKIVEETVTSTPYGDTVQKSSKDMSYYGKEAQNTRYKNVLDVMSYVKENMPEESKTIFCITTSNPIVLGEVEADCDAILMAFGSSFGISANSKYFLQIASGQYEPSALLPFQLPASMDTVEAQNEDAPRDMECYVDADGNTYDFAYGMNWSGVISDERTEKYGVEALTEVESIDYE